MCFTIVNVLKLEIWHNLVVSMEVIDDNASKINVVGNEIVPFRHFYPCLTFEGKAYFSGALDRIHPHSGETG
jgi:hypothetical protein